MPNELAKRIDIVGIDRHDVAMRMGVEIANRQLLHVLEEVGAKTQQGALPHIDHQAVVDIGADDADDEDSSKGEECAGKRCEIGILALGEWDDIVVDEGAREERGNKGRDGVDDDTQHHDSQRKLVVASDITEDAFHHLPTTFRHLGRHTKIGSWTSRTTSSSYVKLSHNLRPPPSLPEGRREKRKLKSEK